MRGHRERRQSNDAVRERYDRLASAPASPFTEHVHHGYWAGASDLLTAQTKLIEKLARFARIPRGARVLDIGCGTGGAARWLAENLGCSVLGISISPVEIAIATGKARAAGAENLIEFCVRDANKMDFLEASFDAVWILETSEHLADKRRFFEGCARVLKSGGRLALAACTATEKPRARQTELLSEVRKVLLTEPLATLPGYTAWISESGFEQIKTEDMTGQVAETWSRISDLLRKQSRSSSGNRGDEREMIKLLAAMRAAYAENAMSYGILSAQKNI